MSNRLQQKVALVTGGGSGIGEAICRRFAEEGCTVVVTDIVGDKASVVAEGIVADGGKALALVQDVTDEAMWQTVMAQIIEQCGGLNVLVNNAGIAIPGTVEDASLDDWRKTQAVNLESVFLGTRAAVAAMQQSGGSIINISSIEGIVGEPKMAAYNASKGGVRLFTKSAALHCAEQDYSIRVNSVHPGFIQTPLIEGALAAMPADEAQAMFARVVGNIPLKKLGSPVDIAHACLYLASDESVYMTGSELVIDGGHTAK
jgi:3(or 17)beta-hydroxysteroid dehydrogenase